jgi:predicted small lipoprotein YifL
MARKTLIALMLVAAATSLSACGRKGQLDSPSTAAEKAAHPDAKPTPTPTPDPSLPPAP